MQKAEVEKKNTIAYIKQHKRITLLQRNYMSVIIKTEKYI